MRGAIDKGPLSFHLFVHKVECHMALPQGYLVGPILGTEARSRLGTHPFLLPQAQTAAGCSRSRLHQLTWEVR